jgi:ABC-type uncharacterized transport system involved in gliding motility auxiliary subunit
MLEEFEDASRGKLNLKIIDPLPFSEQEDQAAQFGLEGVQLPTTPDAIYLGLAGTNSIGDEEVIAFFSPDRLESLEYDIAKLVSTLADPERTVVGLVSGVAMTGGFDPQSQRMTPAWVVYEQASQLFEIRDLGTSFKAVPEDVGLLWIVQPKNLSAATQYAIDQFVMNGGQTLIFVDPLAQVDAMVQQGMPQGMPPVGQSSNLPQLFRGWGVVFEPQSVVADSTLALRLTDPMSGRPVRHYAYLGLGPEQMNRDDVVTMELGSINAAMTGALAKAEGSDIGFEPLLWSSEDSAKLPASRFSFLMNPSELQQGFTPAGERFVLAARISGTLPSAFPEGPPAEDPPSMDPPGDEGAAAEEDAAYGEDGEELADEDHLAASAAPVNLVLVADVDLLSDPLWVTVQNFFGQQIASAFAGNGAFAVNSLESLAGSPDLIAVRSRGGWSRPFTRVDELRADAEARFLETEQRLQQELAETERRLGELQSAREDTGSLLLTDAQEAEIDRFVEQRAEIRQELRSVQRGLDEDIDKLGTWLKVINIALVPLLLTIGTVLLLWHRRRRIAA